MITTDWKRIGTLAMLAGLVGACDTGTEPTDGPSFDAEAALEDYQALDSLLGSSIMEGFRAMSQGVTFASFGEEVRFAGMVGSNLDRLLEPGRSGPVVPLLGSPDRVPSPTLLNPIISSFRRGKTFVYDPSRGRYVMDETREGAPETGVRFILYEPGPEGRPDPEKEIGYADLIDEGDTSAEEIALRLMVVEGEETVLDYRTAVDILDRGGRVTVAGYLQGEWDRLDFDIEVQGGAVGDGATMDISFEMGIAERDFLITGSVHGANGESGRGGTIDLTVRHGTDSFTVQVTLGEGAIDGTFFLNGERFATVTGDPNAPSIAGASGDPLTWTETLVLRQILDSTEDVFDLFEDLLDPVDELVILALIL